MGPVTVRRVIDGDTIEVIYRDRKERVRFIGVDTPETVHPDKPVQPYGPEASDYTKKSLEGKNIWLEFDVELRDHYGRLLAYIWLEEPHDHPGDGNIRRSMFQARLLSEGYARLLTVPPNVCYVDYFKEYQTKAREANRGLWNIDQVGLKTTPPPAQPTTSGYIGNKNSHVFHMPSCQGASEMKEKNRVGIRTRDEAIKGGFKPCGTCKP
jgi:micrococcal nuclease